MSTFDSGRYDLPTLIAKLRDQRFDGYDSESLAQEVEKFRDGGGTASMGDAVDALKQIAAALAQTDQTLRDQLGAMGVHWQSTASGQAGEVMAQQAGFSADANSKVSGAARLIFEQGEAFNRTKNKLPDPDVLRQGGGGYTVGDSLFSLFGFETDHAKDVRASLEARAQTVDALNSYAHDTGDYLASSEEVAEPQSVNVATGAGPGAVLAGAGVARTLAAPAPDLAPTQAASAKDAMPTFAAPATAPQVAHTPTADVATPPLGVPVRQTSSAGGAPPAPQSTAPSSATAPASAPSAAPGLASGPVRTGSGYPRDISRPAPVQSAPSNPTVTPGPQLPGLVPGSQPGGPDQQAPGRSTAWAKPGIPANGSPADGRAGLPVDGRGGVPAEGPGGARIGGPGGGSESLLGKGKVFGSTPGAAGGPPNVGPGFALKGAAGAGGVAEGAPAIAAAGAGGAVGGDEERRGRRGQNAAGKRAQQLPVGDLPEEGEAHRAKKAAPQPPSRERTRAILEPAATQDGDPDAAHVRRYGIDDKDLFTDPREVSPDLIGDHSLPEDR